MAIVGPGIGELADMVDMVDTVDIVDMVDMVEPGIGQVSRQLEAAVAMYIKVQNVLK